jgi:uncharacterized repeat protein (TIGR03803 family)
MKQRGGSLVLAVMLVLGLLAVPSAQAQTFTVLYSFTGSPDGEYPYNYGSLLMDGSGNLYGTTQRGGTNKCGYGCGTVFEVDASGNETVLYSFNAIDGASPYAGLIRDADGNLYGTTDGGGGYGAGAAFKLDTSGGETVLHRFGYESGDGTNPVAGLILDAKGNLYGTTSGGGAHSYGTVYKLSKTGKETVLYSFDWTGGATPLAGLIEDAQGNLYGTTSAGGSGYKHTGTVFKLSKSGVETVLHSFGNREADGQTPEAGLISDADGNLYGTTVYGGGNPGSGTVFKVSKTGKEKVLYTFTGGADGSLPVAGVIRDEQGNLYGTTERGGDFGPGTVFKVDTSGKETVLYSFTGGSDGASPYAGLILDASGNLYGTTPIGGAYGYGVVFKLTP